MTVFIGISYICLEKSRLGVKKASADGIPIRSISVDTWGVDYAYLDQNGDLLYQPHCYRDNRMGQYEETFYKKISKEALFEETGVQPACINTVLQIFADLQEKPHLAKSCRARALHAGFD